MFFKFKALCCKQAIKTEHFKSSQTNRTFRIFQKAICKSNFIIYILECELCKIQYVGKAETTFNIWLNNHRKDVKDPKAILEDKHFSQTEHILNLHAKFIIIEQLQGLEKTSNEILKERLKTQETFWIKKLKILTPSGLNQDLSWIQEMQFISSKFSFYTASRTPNQLWHHPVIWHHFCLN